MANTEEIRLAGELIDAFSAGDWARFRATIAPDVAYEETGTGRRTEGADAYVALCQGWRAAFPDASGTIERAVASSTVVAQEVLWEGTQTGPLATASGTLPPSGRRIAVRATLWYTLRDGRATAIRHHLDVLTMLGQLGALPTA
jgi:steroid delta-isomerase-like uncharacterized protein